MRTPVLRRLAVFVLAAGVAGATAVLPAGPAAAAGRTTLAVTLTTTPAVPQPGAAVTYTVAVRNTGTVSASRVQIDMTTSLGLTGISYKVSAGHCYRSALETACILGTVKAGATATANISGTLPKAPRYTKVSTTVKVVSDTALTGPAQATHDYPLGGPSPVPVRPSPSALAAEPTGPPPGGGNSLLQASTGTRIFAIAFAVVVVGLILAGRWWEARRRKARGDGPAQPPTEDGEDAVAGPTAELPPLRPGGDQTTDLSDVLGLR